MLSGTYAKFTQNPAIKNYLLSTGIKLLAEASPLDPVRGIGVRSDYPRARDLRQWRGTIFLDGVLSAVRDAIRASEAGSAHPAASRRFCTPTGNAEIHEIPQRRRPAR